MRLASVGRLGGSLIVFQSGKHQMIVPTKDSLILVGCVCCKLCYAFQSLCHYATQALPCDDAAS